MANEAQSDTRVPIVEKRLRLAAVFTCLGLLVQLITLLRIHPLAFVAFILIGCPLVLVGILLYLYSIVSHEPETRMTI
jgi:hypothetical protein